MREQSCTRLLNVMGLHLDKNIFGNRFTHSLRLLRNVTMSISMAFILVGCSSLPDAVNPVNWYKTAKSAILGDDNAEGIKTENGNTKELVAEGENIKTGSDKNFPSLGSVPERPSSSNGKERKKIAKALISDRQDVRQYSGEIMSRQGEDRSVSNAIPNNQSSRTPTETVPSTSHSNRLSSEATDSQTLPQKLTPSNVARKN